MGYIRIKEDIQDTLFSKVKLKTDNKFAHLFFNRTCFFYRMEHKSKVHDAFTKFILEVGTPHKLYFDDARELVSEEFKKKVSFF